MRSSSQLVQSLMQKRILEGRMLGILKARQLICDGLWWRVGDNTDTKVWGDNWLTEPHLPRLISPCPAPYRDLPVAVH